MSDPSKTPMPVAEFYRNRLLREAAEYIAIASRSSPSHLVDKLFASAANRITAANVITRGMNSRESLFGRIRNRFLLWKHRKKLQQIATAA
jgi:hypothetical protein